MLSFDKFIASLLVASVSTQPWPVVFTALRNETTLAVAAGFLVTVSTLSIVVGRRVMVTTIMGGGKR